MKISFYKYQATGNDFVVLDNRNHQYEGLRNEDIIRLCHRRFGIGADGLMMLENTDGYDFEMKYFNADGSLGSMCGNGGRCIVAFALKSGIEKDEYSFLAYDGRHFARIGKDGIVSLKMADVNHVDYREDSVVLDTGSPHYVSFVNDVKHLDVFNKGRGIRNSPEFVKAGINVNFVEKTDEGSIYVRTYERGVEDETYSCGTGVTAAAIAGSGEEDGRFETRVLTKGGQLSVSFVKEGNQMKDIWLTGPATFVFAGEINLETS